MNFKPQAYLYNMAHEILKSQLSSANYWSLAIEYTKVFSMTRTSFSHIRSAQFSKHNVSFCGIFEIFLLVSCFRCCYDWRWRTRWCKWRNKLWVYGNDYPGLIKPSKITFRDGENFCISHQIENSKNNFKSQCGYARKPFAKQYVIVSCWLFAYFLLFVKNFWVILKIQNLFFREYIWWSVQIFWLQGWLKNTDLEMIYIFKNSWKVEIRFSKTSKKRNHEFSNSRI